MIRRLFLILLVMLVAVLLARHSLTPPPTPSHFAFGRGPDIVIVHGLGSTMEHWLPTARRLARTHRVTLVQLPGHGLAEMPQPFTLEQAAAALDRALTETSNGPVILVGHSLGGLVAAQEALNHPERVRGLLLVETSLRPQVKQADVPGLLRSLDENYDQLLHDAYIAMGRDSAQGEQLYAEVARMDPAVVKPWIRLAWMADLSGMMKKLQPRLLAVLAPHSWTVEETWVQASEALGYSQVPRVRGVRVEGCGHFIMIDRPEQLAEIIARFAANPESDVVAGR